MTGNDEGVFCGNCGLKLHVRSDVPAEKREPCPVCGSTVREFIDSGTVGLRLGVTIATAGEVEAASRVHAESVPADSRPEAETLRDTYQVTLVWSTLADGVWMLQLFNEAGELVEGGIADNDEDALLALYERMLPPK